MAEVESESECASLRKQSANDMHSNSEYRRGRGRGDSIRYEKELAKMQRAPTVSQIGRHSGYQLPDYASQALNEFDEGVTFANQKYALANEMHSESRIRSHSGDDGRYKSGLAKLGRAPTVSQIGRHSDSEYRMTHYTDTALHSAFAAMKRRTSAKDIHCVATSTRNRSQHYAQALAEMKPAPTVRQIGRITDYQSPQWSEAALKDANSPTTERFMVPASNVKTDYVCGRCFSHLSPLTTHHSPLTTHHSRLSSPLLTTVVSPRLGEIGGADDSIEMGRIKPKNESRQTHSIIHCGRC